MRYLRYISLLAVLGIGLIAVPAAHAQVVVGVGVGPGYVAGPPVCPYGYYPYYPYACAPYGYYGPDWFVSGVFIGAGPWYGWGWGHGWHHGWYGGRGWYGGHGWNGRPGYGGRGYAGPGRGYAGRAPVAGGFRGGAGFRG